jgi:hypothetical protein
MVEHAYNLKYANDRERGWNNFVNMANALCRAVRKQPEGRDEGNASPARFTTKPRLDLLLGQLAQCIGGDPSALSFRARGLGSRFESPACSIDGCACRSGAGLS